MQLESDKSNKMPNTRQKGRSGEDQASAWLESQGFIVLERNWYFSRTEIDLIAVEGDELVVIEVKSRRAPMLESPEQAVDALKRRSIVRAANAWVRQHRVTLDVRFDVIFVLEHREHVEILHIRRAFYPML